MRKKTKIAIYGAVAFVLLLTALFFIVRALYSKPYSETVEAGGIEPSLVYSVMKAESNFREKAKSNAGAVGIMQIKPSTAQFICEQNDIPFEAERLYEGDYNVALGCAYLCYLSARFSDIKTVLAAYNAGEGTVSKWLNNTAYSEDGIRLKAIPYPETRDYVKKVLRYKKIYDLLY